jgi:hypothetical protein
MALPGDTFPPAITTAITAPFIKANLSPRIVTAAWRPFPKRPILTHGVRSPVTRRISFLPICKSDPALSSTNGRFRVVMFSPSGHGYAGTSMSQICKASQISASAVYWHFENKEGVMAAMLERGITRYLDAVESVSQTPGKSPVSKLAQPFD